MLPLKSVSNALEDEIDNIILELITIMSTLTKELESRIQISHALVPLYDFTMRKI